MEDPTDGQDPFAPPRTTHTNCNKSRGAVLVTYLDNGRDPDIAREAARESLPFDEDSPDQGPRRATAANSNLMGGPSLQRLAADALQAVSIATASPPLAASVPKMIPDKSTATRQCSIQDEPPSAPRFTPPQRAPLPDKPQRRLRHGVRALADGRRALSPQSASTPATSASINSTSIADRMSSDGIRHPQPISGSYACTVTGCSVDPFKTQYLLNSHMNATIALFALLRKSNTNTHVEITLSESSNEAKIILALQALQNDPKLSLRKAAAIYHVDRFTLSRRRHGILSKRDTLTKSRLLSDQEEDMIVQFILGLDSRGFPSRLLYVEDIANSLRANRGAPPVGKRWAHNFIKRQPELKTHKFRRYDYQRAKCEDPTIIRGWFRLVENTIAKYGIRSDDIWNFDETGFMMGVIEPGIVITGSHRQGRPKQVQPGNREWITVIEGINAEGQSIPPFIIGAGKDHLANWYQECDLPGDWVIALSENGWTNNNLGLEWLKHFDRATAKRTNSRYRLLILDGHESHHSVEFEEYCKENKIITLSTDSDASRRGHDTIDPLDCKDPKDSARGPIAFQVSARKDQKS
ncbi:hypothetical protein HZS61_006461 [Fusarium oxysporum f. sp. conglutinans]|uniref:HTH CENPB-type domain-containing protein n=1 Tax=Fusarium oxysporum f. sp. conglutinans TaxID=100902 RepID=A0A8H6LCL8_FUSOX|nr:hypothetical protein HZS61_006461 [Fusarium oxysporum f. sp. conglutinans]